MSTIRLEHVVKLYKSNNRKFAALLDADLQIEQGEFVFFVGSSGAGTSTLLNLISGELKPDDGVVFLDQLNLEKLSRRQERRLPYIFGKVSQEPSLVRTETVFSNFCSMRKADFLKNKLIDEPLIKKALGLVGMSGCEQRYPVEFSMSECRKIELAKAITYSPPILILDEITERMDDDSAWDIFQLLNELNQRGTTILMATRSKKYVNIMRKRVVTLSDGKIVGDVQRGRFGDIIGHKASRQFICRSNGVISERQRRNMK